MHDLDTRLERLAAEATRNAVPPEPTAIARRGRRRRRRQLAGSALVVVAVVAAGVVLPSRLVGRSGPDPVPATAPPIDVRGAAMLGGYWFGKTDASVLLGGGTTPAEREAVRRRLQALDVVDQVFYESKAEAYARMRERYRTRPEVTRYMTIAGMAESFRVRLDAPEDFPRLQRALCPGPGRSPTRRGFCLDRVEVVEDLALVKTPLLPERWATSSDLSVFLPAGTTDAGREAVRARLEAVGGVARVTYESPAEAYRQLPEWLRRNSRDPATVLLLSPEMMRAAFRVALDEPARAGEVHQALCGSRRTGACPGGLVVLEHPRR
jgi:FtsX-like permease family protein